MSEMHPLLRRIMNDPKARFNTAVANRPRRRHPEWWRGYFQARMRLNMHVRITKFYLSSKGNKE